MILEQDAVTYEDPAELAMRAEEGGADGCEVSEAAGVLRLCLERALSAGVFPEVVAREVARMRREVLGPVGAGKRLAGSWGGSLRRWCGGDFKDGQWRWRMLRMSEVRSDREVGLHARECMMKGMPGVVGRRVRGAVPVWAELRGEVARGVVEALCRKGERWLGAKETVERWMVAAWKVEDLRREALAGMSKARLAGVLQVSRARVAALAQEFDFLSPGDARSEVRAATSERRMGNRSRRIGAERERLRGLVGRVKDEG